MSQWWEKYVGKIINAGIFFPEEDWLDIKSTYGNKLWTYRFHNPRPKALICMFHGMYGESNEASYIAKNFFEAGFAVAAFDQDSHGKSEGIKGNIESLKAYAQDCLNFIKRAKACYPENTPVFVNGFSMGGTMCVMLALLKPELLNGIILLAPGLGASPDFEPFLQKVVRCLNSCCGGLKLKKMDFSQVTRNKDFEKFFEENPLNYTGKMNVRTAVAFLNGFQELAAIRHEVKVPILAFHGDADKIADPEETKEFIRICKSTDKELVLLPDLPHDLYNENEINLIIEKSIDWIETRLPGSSDNSNRII